MSDLRAALEALSKRHEWTPGMGPCVCDEHKEARRLLAATPEPPAWPSETVDSLAEKMHHAYWEDRPGNPWPPVNSDYHAAWLRAALAALKASEPATPPAPSEPHKPGDNHHYRITCEECGERGMIRLSVDPQRFGEAGALDAATHEPAVDDFGNQYLERLTPEETAQKLASRIRVPAPSEP